MTESEYLAWEAQIDLPIQGKALLRRIRSSQPVRQSTGWGESVRGRYPSQKMQHMVSYDSHTVELSFIYLLENDDSVIEYYDQPPAFSIHWENDKGEAKYAPYTPDFVVIQKDRVIYVECKNDEFLQEALEKKPGKFIFSEGIWTLPGAIEAARADGFEHAVWTPTKEIRMVRNYAILDDYLSESLDSVPKEVIEKVKAEVKKRGRISLQSLRDTFQDVTADHLNVMILRKAIFVDLRKDLLIAPEATWAYESQIMAEALAPALEEFDHSAIPIPVDVTVGAEIEWDGQPMTIKLVTEEKIYLEHNGQATEFSIKDFHRYLKKGAITGRPSKANQQMLPDAVSQMLLEAAKEDLMEAAKRQKAVEERDPTIHPRTLARWMAAELKAQAMLGVGLLGLLRKKGANRNPRVDPLVVQTAQEVIKKEYSTRTAPSIISCYKFFVDLCASRLVKPYSYQSFAAEVQKANQRKLVEDRLGPRSAYSIFGTTPFTSLSRDTPPHGDHPWHIGHIDHTEMDVFPENPFDGKKHLRPWLTTFLLAHCRLVVAYWITFCKPSSSSVLMVLRICLKRFGRIPQCIVVDGGKDLSGTDISLLQASLRFTLKIRPPHQARFGSPLESTYHSANCHLFHNMEGNTKITKNVRQVTKSNDPRNLATLALTDLGDRTRHYFETVCPNVDHPALLTTPKKAFQEGLSRMGNRPHKYFSYTPELEMFLSPLVEGCTRMATPNGVKYKGFFYYHPVVLSHIDETLEVKEDPADCRHVFVRIGKKMFKFECRSRFWFFDRIPGHDSLVSQLVLGSQSEILSRRPHEIHAGVAAYQPLLPAPNNQSMSVEVDPAAGATSEIPDGDATKEIFENSEKPVTKKRKKDKALPVPALSASDCVVNTVLFNAHQGTNEDELEVIKL